MSLHTVLLCCSYCFPRSGHSLLPGNTRWKTINNNQRGRGVDKAWSKDLDCALGVCSLGCIQKKQQNKIRLCSELNSLDKQKSSFTQLIVFLIKSSVMALMSLLHLLNFYWYYFCVNSQHFVIFKINPSVWGSSWAAAPLCICHWPEEIILTLITSQCEAGFPELLQPLRQYKHKIKRAKKTAQREESFSFLQSFLLRDQLSHQTDIWSSQQHLEYCFAERLSREDTDCRKEWVGGWSCINITSNRVNIMPKRSA